MKTQAEDMLPQLRADQLIEHYRKMLLIRRVEEMAEKAYDRGKVGGYMHVYIGQEALAVGTLSLIKPTDPVIAPYRIHGYALTLGMPPEAVMAELFGKVDGCSKGKGGSMHLFDRKHNFYGGYGIIGCHVPIATGLGFACKYRDTSEIVVCYLGDGSVNAGAFHESLNMAGLWKLPVIYVIENNLYAMGTSLERSSAETELYKRGIAHGIPAKQMEAMDITEVIREFAPVVDEVRAGRGPYLVEAMTYRYEGHGAADKPALQSYRTQDEVADWRVRDPISRLGEQLVSERILLEAELKKINEEMESAAQAAYDFADASPEPPLEEVFTDVYTDLMPEGCDTWQK